MVALFSLWSSAPALSSDYTIPNVFVPGSTARSSDVNSNFSAAKTAIDNNNARITSLESSVVTPLNLGIYRASDYTSGSFTGGIQEAYNAALAANGGEVLVGPGVISFTRPFVCNAGFASGDGSNGVIIKGLGTAKIDPVTNASLDGDGTVISWADSTTESRWIDKTPGAFVGGGWAVGSSLTWSGGTGTLISVNITKKWLEVENTSGVSPANAVVVTNATSGGTLTTSSAAAAERYVAAMFRLEGCSNLTIRDLALIGDVSNNDTNVARLGIWIRARDSASATSSGIRIINVDMYDFARTAIIPLYSGGVIVDGDWPVSATHAGGLTDNLYLENVNSSYVDSCFEQWGTQASSTNIIGGQCKGWRRFGYLFASGNANLIGTSGSQSAKSAVAEIDDPLAGQPVAFAAAHPFGSDMNISLEGVNATNLIGRFGTGTVGVCSEDVSDTTQDPIEWTMCLENAECSGTCKFVGTSVTTTGKGSWSQAGGSMSIMNMGAHDGGNNVADLVDGLGIDSPASWIGLTLYNTTDGSSCVITGETGAGAPDCTLAGGIQNDWDTADRWEVGTRYGTHFKLAGNVSLPGMSVATAGASANVTKNVVYNNTDNTSTDNTVKYVGPYKFNSPYITLTESSDLAYNKIINITSQATACAEYTSAFKEYHNGTAANGQYRVKVNFALKGIDALDPSFSFYDGSGAWPYNACFIHHPVSSTNGFGTGNANNFPDSLGAINNNVAAVNGSSNIELTIDYTGFIEIDKTDQVKDAVLIELGNQYMAGCDEGGDSDDICEGEFYGQLNGSVKIQGQLDVRIIAQNDNSPNWTGEGTMSMGKTDRLSKEVNTAFAIIGNNGGTYSDLSGLTLNVSNLGNTDIAYHQIGGNGSLLPRLIVANDNNDGVGAIFYGTINQTGVARDWSLRNMDHAIMLGDADNGGQTVLYESCDALNFAGGTCGNASTGVGLATVIEGVHIDGITIENPTWSMVSVPVIGYNNEITNIFAKNDASFLGVDFALGAKYCNGAGSKPKGKLVKESSECTGGGSSAVATGGNSTYKGDLTLGFANAGAYGYAGSTNILLGDNCTTNNKITVSADGYINDSSTGSEFTVSDSILSYGGCNIVAKSPPTTQPFPSYYNLTEDYNRVTGNDAIYFASTQAEAEAALARIARNYGSSVSTGGTIQLACGPIAWDNFWVGAADSGALSHSGLVIRGCGGGGIVAWNGAGAGGSTTLQASTATPMISLGSCATCRVENLVMDGNGVATVGIDWADTGIGFPSTQGHIEDVHINHVNGPAVRIGYYEIPAVSLTQSAGTAKFIADRNLNVESGNQHEFTILGASVSAYNGNKTGYQCVDAFSGAEIPQINDGDIPDTADGFCDNNGTDNALRTFTFPIAGATASPAGGTPVFHSPDMANTQVDTLSITNSILQNNKSCYHQMHSQSIGITLTKVTCSNLYYNGLYSDPVLDLNNGLIGVNHLAGEIAYYDGYWGSNADNQIFVNRGWEAARLTVRNNQLETHGTTNGYIVKDDDISGQTVGATIATAAIIDSNQLVYAGAMKFLSVKREGSYLVSHNTFLNQGVNNECATSTFASDEDPHTEDRLRLTHFGNNESCNSANDYPDTWNPTVAVDVIVQYPAMASDSEPSDSGDCVDGQIWVDTNAPDEAQVHVCVSGAWTLQDGGAGGGGAIQVLAAASLPGTGVLNTIYKLSDASSTTDCDNVGGGSTYAHCGWNGTIYVSVGVASTGLTNPLITSLDLGSNSINNAASITGVNLSLSSTSNVTWRLNSDSIGGTDSFYINNGTNSNIFTLREATGDISTGGHLTVAKDIISGTEDPIYRGKLKLLGGTAADDYYSILAPSTGAGGINLTLPDVLGTSGFVLRTNGAGITSWVDAISSDTSPTLGGNLDADKYNITDVGKLTQAPLVNVANVNSPLHETTNDIVSWFDIYGAKNLLCTDSFRGTEVPQISDGDIPDTADGFCDFDGTSKVGKTKTVGQEIYSINLSKSESYGQWITLLGGGDTDLVGQNIDVFSTGGAQDSGDEGSQIWRGFINDYWLRVEGALNTGVSLTAGAGTQTASTGTSVSQEESKMVGEGKLAIFTGTGALTVSVTDIPPGIINSAGTFDLNGGGTVDDDPAWSATGAATGQGVWTLSASPGITSTGYCFTPHDSAYYDINNDVLNYVWLKIVNVSGSTITTEWLAQGYNPKTPLGMLGSEGTSNASIAACATLGRPVFEDANYTADSLVFIKDAGFPGTASAAVFKVFAYPNHAQTGVNLMMANTLGTKDGSNGFKATNIISGSPPAGTHQLNAAFYPTYYSNGAFAGRLKDGKNHAWKYGLKCDDNGCETGINYYYSPDPSNLNFDQRFAALNWSVEDYNNDIPRTVFWNIPVSLKAGDLSYDKTDGWGEGAYQYGNFKPFAKLDTTGTNLTIAGNFIGGAGSNGQRALTLQSNTSGLGVPSVTGECDLGFIGSDLAKHCQGGSLTIIDRLAVDPLWTTAGDLAYATASATATRLGIGTTGQALVSTGTAPSWSNDIIIGSGSTITLPNSASPASTTLARMEFENDDMHIIVGDNGAQVEFVPAEDFSIGATVTDAGVVTVDGTQHSHTSAQISGLDSSDISGLDISADTNLAFTAPIVLTDDTLSISAATTTTRGAVELATDEETIALSTGSTDFIVRVSNLAALDASTTQQGIVVLATGTEANNGTEASKAITPLALEAWTGSAQLIQAGALVATSIDTSDPGNESRRIEFLTNSTAIGTPMTNECNLGFTGTTATASLKQHCNGGSLQTLPRVVASGVEALATSAIGAGVCVTTDTAISAAGVVAADILDWSWNAAPDDSTSKLIVSAYAGSATVNFKVCNPTAGSLTPAIVSINWRVTR